MTWQIFSQYSLGLFILCVVVFATLVSKNVYIHGFCFFFSVFLLRLLRVPSISGHSYSEMIKKKSSITFSSGITKVLVLH